MLVPHNCSRDNRARQECVVISIITLVLERGGLRRHYHEISQRQANLRFWNQIKDQYRILPVHSLENLDRFKLRDFFLLEVLSLDTQATLHKIVCARKCERHFSRPPPSPPLSIIEGEVWYTAPFIPSPRDPFSHLVGGNSRKHKYQLGWGGVPGKL